MNFKSPKSEPIKSYEKNNIEKGVKVESSSKSEQELKNKHTKKIEPRKIDPKKEPKHKLQLRKVDPKVLIKNKSDYSDYDLKAPTRNKIERPKIDLYKEPKNKIEREKIDLYSPARNKIERPKIDLYKEPKNKIEREKIDLNSPARNKIERPKIDFSQKSNNIIQGPHFDLKTPPGNKKHIRKFAIEKNQHSLVKPSKPLNTFRLINQGASKKPKNSINYTSNLLNEKLQNKLKEYFNQTGTYATWGLQIKQSFIEKISEDEKNSAESLKHMCKEINVNHDIQRYIVDLKRSKNYSNLKIIRELKEMGLNVSRSVVGKIFSLQTGNDTIFLTKNTKWSFLDRNEKGLQLSYEEQVKNAALFLKKNILTNQFKEKYELAPN